jgi:hypothetical protein
MEWNKIKKIWSATVRTEDRSRLNQIWLGWLIASEAFLAAAYATVLTVPTDAANPRFDFQSNQLFYALPIAGMVLAFVVGISIWAALRSMGKLKKEYASLTGHPSYLPDATIRRRLYYAGSTAPFLVPPLTIAGWIYIFLVGSPN